MITFSPGIDTDEDDMQHWDDDEDYVEFPAGEFPPQANIGPLE